MKITDPKDLLIAKIIERFNKIQVICKKDIFSADDVLEVIKLVSVDQGDDDILTTFKEAFPSIEKDIEKELDHTETQS